MTLTTAAGIGMATESWDYPAVKPSVNGSGNYLWKNAGCTEKSLFMQTNFVLLLIIYRKSAAKWIINAVITEAKILLREPDKTINQIAIELNFPDQSTFGKFFKRNTGLSPLEYKKGEKTTNGVRI